MTMNVVSVKRLMLLDLSESSREKINRKLPNAGKELNWLSNLPQEWVDHLAGPESKLPTAKVCLHDAASVACQVDYALGQAYAHLIWFRQECPDAPMQSEAHHYGRFYADDAALRLYSAAEHVANFIVAFLHISSNELIPYQKNDKSAARAVVVGKYLRKQKPEHLVTDIVNRILSDEWELVRNYRNDWVHNKPPILDGPGLDYKRTSRWSTMGEAQMLLLGVRYAPDYTLDGLLEAILKAACDFKMALSGLTDLLFQELEVLGIKRDVDAGTITLPDNFWDR
jgi:hypothetical protein